MNAPPTYSSYVQRAYSLHRTAANQDIDYLRHPSGPIVLQLRENHPAYEKGITSVDFDISNKNKKGKDRSKQNVTGKGKKVRQI